MRRRCIANTFSPRSARFAPVLGFPRRLTIAKYSARPNSNVRQEDFDVIKDQPDLYAKAIKHMKKKGIQLKASKATGQKASTGTKRLADDSVGGTNPKVAKSQPILSLSAPSAALASRYKPINNGKAKKKRDIGESIGNHLVPIGFLSRDLNPQRVAFASITLNGRIAVTLYPVTTEWQGFESTPAHEDNLSTYVKHRGCRLIGTKHRARQ
ncbi:hypothetical protein GJ744_000747 [Endocarpon pusillum]|uniref:Uncharacterized protein n=1 Tax=Endocarpon pusillum TaxID=364733 RepID=A0A8H7AAB7_9EURO|nr:hypothetical protein GJ744_000747 [Endocarpon pusillum]